jgi:hypothetical protein
VQEFRHLLNALGRTNLRAMLTELSHQTTNHLRQVRKWRLQFSPVHGAVAGAMRVE